MIKKFLSLLAAFMPFILLGQVAYFSIGYNVNYFTSENLDFVVTRYNETRTYLDKQMNLPRYFDGLDMHIGTGERVFTDFGFSWRSSKVSAEGIDATGVNNERDLKYKHGDWGLGVGYYFIQSDSKIGLGYYQTFGFEKISTRVGPADNISEVDYEKFFSELNAGGEIFLQSLLVLNENTAFIVRPSYHFSFTSTDYAPVNAMINPATAGSDPEILESKLHGIGISVMLAFGSYED
ncbi:MAG: hypothetical protein ACHQFW_10080 [Chitinophagales bacterium]